MAENSHETSNLIFIERQNNEIQVSPAGILHGPLRANIYNFCANVLDYIIECWVVE